MSPDSELYPQGATAAFQGVLSVTVPGAYQAQVIANLPSIPGLQLDAVGVTVRSGTIQALNQSGAVVGTVPFTIASPTTQTGPVDTSPTGGTTFTVPVSGSITTNGADGDVVGFVPGPVVVDNFLDVAIATQTLPCNGAVANNQDQVVDAGEGPAFGLQYPAPRAANIGLVATSPTVVSGTSVLSSAANTSTVNVQIDKAVPQNSLALADAQHPTGQPSGTAASVVSWTAQKITGAAGSTLVPAAAVGQFTYGSPGNTYAGVETWKITATDALGATSFANITLDVKKGDAANETIDVTVNPGSLVILECGDADPGTCPTIQMSPVTLDGSDKSSTGAMNQLSVVDARGLYLGWTLSAALDGPLQNTQPKGPAGDPNDQIEATDVIMTPTTCATKGAGFAGPSSQATAGSQGNLSGTGALALVVCSATAGHSGGTFLANANISLTVQADNYAGAYTGVINFLLS